MPAPAAGAAGAGAWVAAALALAPPRPPATPAAPRLCSKSCGSIHLALAAGTNDPDADHEKGAIAPRRFGVPRRRRPRKRRRGSLGKLIPRSWAESPRTCRKGCGRSRHPPARTAHETCRGRAALPPERAARTTTRGRRRAPIPPSQPPDGRRGRPGAVTRAAAPGRLAGPGYKRPTHPCRRPRPVALRRRGRRLARPAPRRSWTRTPWTLILGRPAAPEIRAPSAGSWADLGAGRSPGGRRPGAGAIWGRSRAITLPPSPARPARRRRRPSCRLQWYRRRPKSPAGPGTCRPAQRPANDAAIARHRRAGRLRRPAGHRAAAAVGASVRPHRRCGHIPAIGPPQNGPPSPAITPGRRTVVPLAMLRSGTWGWIIQDVPTPGPAAPASSNSAARPHRGGRRHRRVRIVSRVPATRRAQARGSRAGRSAPPTPQRARAGGW